MRNKLMKRLVVMGGIIVIVFLIILLGRRFQKEPYTEEPIPTDINTNSEVVVKNSDILEKEDKEDKEFKEETENKVTVAPIITEDPSQDDSAEDAKTEQKIQEDIPPKPTYTEEQLADPTKKPNGEKVEEPKIKEKKTTATPKPEDNTNNTPEDNNSSGGLPGFDDVPDGGANQVIDGDSDGDIDKQVGTMD
jgi:cytoskeletal protein RodZ